MPGPTLPRFEVVARLRPVDLVAPSAVAVDDTAPGTSSDRALAQPAPYAAVVADLGPGAGPLTLRLAGGSTVLAAQHDHRGTALTLTVAGRTTHHRSRRHARAAGPVDALGLTLTGTHLTALTRQAGRWTTRARVDLAAHAERVDPRDEAFPAGLRVGHEGRATRLVAGGFGQLGLRDVRAASHADGAPYLLEDGRLLLTATSAGPGFFDTAHTSVWALDPDAPALEHRGDLFFRRPGRPGVYGDHATHLLRDGGRWRVATSTWGDFDRRRPDASVAVTLAESAADLTRGRHVLDTRPLPLPTTGLTSVGVWDPHLVRTDDGWLAGYVSARRFFRFHPVVAAGPDLDHLALRSADPRRTATEGTTLARLDGAWWVLASDGRDGRRGRRARHPVLDLDLVEVGVLDAPYPTNIPWPTLVEHGGRRLLVTFDGTPYGGELAGYGTHGDLVLMRPVGVSP